MELEPQFNLFLTQQLWAMVRSNFRRDGHLAHVGIFICDRAESEIVLLDGLPKEAIGPLLQQAVERLNAQSLITIAEAWMTEHPIGTNPSTVLRPSLSPNRIEVVAINFQTPMGAWASATPITRPELPQLPEPFVYVPRLEGNFAVRFPTYN